MLVAALPVSADIKALARTRDAIVSKTPGIEIFPVPTTITTQHSATLHRLILHYLYTWSRQPSLLKADITRILHLRHRT